VNNAPDVLDKTKTRMQQCLHMYQSL
jgi:hypothetical protein